jgi:hypothetical protein
MDQSFLVTSSMNSEGFFGGMKVTLALNNDFCFMYSARIMNTWNCACLTTLIFRYPSGQNFRIFFSGLHRHGKTGFDRFWYEIKFYILQKGNLVCVINCS